jgi:hypothetical protein
MALTELTPEQQQAVDALVAANRIRQVDRDPERCQVFLQQAAVALSDLPRVEHAQTRYNIAYDAAHDVGEAMLAAYGYRTTSGQGQHDALAQLLAAIFDTPPEDGAAQHLEQMRQQRNAQRYNAVPHTDASAEVATETATVLRAAAQGRVQ